MASAARSHQSRSLSISTLPADERERVAFGRDVGRRRRGPPASSPGSDWQRLSRCHPMRNDDRRHRGRRVPPARQALGDDADAVHRIGQASQPLHTEVDQLDTGSTGQHRRRHVGDHDLAAARRSHESRRPVERRPEVVAVALLGFAGVQPHAHPDDQRGRATPR